MIKYIAFTYNKHLYATCYGIDPFAAERCPFNNIFDPASAGRGEMRCFTSLVGGDEYSLPRLQDVEVTVADTVAKFIAGKGWIEVGGIRYDVTFDSNSIKCIGPDGIDVNTENPIQKEEDVITEEVTTEETVAVEEVEIVSESAEATTEEIPAEKVEDETPTEEAETSVEEVETQDASLKSLVKKLDIPDISLDFTETPNDTVGYSEAEATFVEYAPEMASSESEEDSVITVPYEGIEDVVVPVDETGEDIISVQEVATEELVEETVTEPELGVADDFMNPPEYEERAKKPSGLTVGNEINSREPVRGKIVLGGSNVSQGIQFGTFKPRSAEAHEKPTLQRKTYTVTGRPVTTQMYERQPVQLPVDAPVPSAAFAQAVAKSEEQLVESWREQVKPDLTQRWDKPAISKEEKLPVEDVVMEPINDSEQRELDKRCFLESVSADVARVIEQIPLHIVGPIAEFTTNPVNVRRLTNESDAYCIDNRWHKAGKWYCIDVVNDTARYFFNSKLNVSIQIPQAILKEWLRIVNG